MSFFPLTRFAVDFALTEAGFTVVRLLQSFQTIAIPEGEAVELLGVEKQDTALVLKIKSGCKVQLCR
jgi:hypothetical protein